MMDADVTVRLCPLNVLAGATFTGVSEEGRGRSAGRMDNDRSTLDVKITREEGKNWREVMAFRWGFPVANAVGGADDDVPTGTMTTVPSS